MNRILPPAVFTLFALISIPIEAEQISVTVVGDVLMVKAPPPECREKLETILGDIRRADIAVANLETSLVGANPVPAPTSGGLWLHAQPGVDAWLHASGLDVVSQANNHAGDWGPRGAAETLRRLDEAGLESAGYGKDEISAWQPALTEVHGRTVAVVAAACLPGNDPMRTRDAELGFARRAGIASIGTRRIVEMIPDRFIMFSTMMRETGMSVPSGTEALNLGDAVVRQGRKPGFVVDLDPGDLDRLRHAVSSANAESDIVLVSLHCAEGEGLGSTPPRVVRSVAADLARLGADAVFVHGPHHLRGAEWVGPGTVALYGLGSLVLQHRQVESQPREAFQRWGVDPTAGMGVLLDRVERAMGPKRELWDGLAATLVFDDGRLDRVELTPLDLAGSGPDDPCRGLPVLAKGGRREEILGIVSERTRGLQGRVVPSELGAVLAPAPDSGTPQK